MINNDSTPPMDTARLIGVIQTTLERRGAGEDRSDPIRIVTQYWSKDGALLAENDPHLPRQQEQHIAQVLDLRMQLNNAVVLEHDATAALEKVQECLDLSRKRVATLEVLKKQAEARFAALQDAELAKLKRKARRTR